MEDSIGTIQLLLAVQQYNAVQFQIHANDDDDDSGLDSDGESDDGDGELDVSFGAAEGPLELPTFDFNELLLSQIAHLCILPRPMYVLSLFFFLIIVHNTYMFFSFYSVEPNVEPQVGIFWCEGCQRMYVGQQELFTHCGMCSACIPNAWFNQHQVSRK